LKKHYTKYIVIYLSPALLIFALIYLYPLLSVFVTSFTRWDGYSTPVFIGLKNFTKLFAMPAFHNAVKNTLIWALCAIFIHVPFGLCVALVLSKKLRGWRFCRAVFLIPNIVAPSAMALLFVFIFKPDEGILNSLLRMIGFTNAYNNWLFNTATAFGSVTMIWLFYAAVVTIIVLSDLLSVSTELYESARIDGASPWQIDRYINLPLLRKAMGACIIIAVAAVFKKFDIIYLTTNGGPGNATMTLSVMMVNAITNTMSYGYANAIAAVLVMMGIFVMGVCNRVFKMGKSAYE